jgi:Uma2 family endonuclease
MLNLKIEGETMLIMVNASSPTTLQKMSQEQFYEFCYLNPDLRIERTTQGEVIVMPPAFADTGNRNFKIIAQLGNWSDQDGTGEGFGSSTGFTLPNGAIRSPDAAWIKLDRWNSLTDEQKASFSSICPDFVIELRSAIDTLNDLKEKMQEYIENGVRLGLLIDRKNLTVCSYRADGSVTVLNNPTIVDCSPELPGFVLQMARIW